MVWIWVWSLVLGHKWEARNRSTNRQSKSPNYKPRAEAEVSLGRRTILTVIVPAHRSRKPQAWHIGHGATPIWGLVFFEVTRLVLPHSLFFVCFFFGGATRTHPVVTGTLVSAPKAETLEG